MTSVANYAGDCSHMVGEVHGPTLTGRLMVVTSAAYYPRHGRTVVHFEPVTPAEVAERGPSIDEFGTLRVDLEPVPA